MKNNFGKILIGALVFSAVVLPVSARGNKNNLRQNPMTNQHFENCPYGYDCNGTNRANRPMQQPMGGRNGMNQPNGRQMPPMMGHHQMGGMNPMGMGATGTASAIMGTVKSFDEKNGILEIEDADKKVKKVHVNPQTRIMVSNRPTTPPAPNTTPAPRANFIEAKDYAETLKSGTWVTVSKFPTETETLEARRIMVQK